MHTGTRFARVSARVLTRARARRRYGFTHSVAARSDAALCPPLSNLSDPRSYVRSRIGQRPYTARYPGVNTPGLHTWTRRSRTHFASARTWKLHYTAGNVDCKLLFIGIGKSI